MNNDLISRSALLKEISTKIMMYDGSCIKKGIGVLLDKWEVLDHIQAAPAVDAEPVRHGRWELETSKYLRCCSACEKVTFYCGAGRHYDYCPNCGAKMDLEV